MIVKKFKWSLERGVYLSNDSEALKFIEDKIEYFSKIDNYLDKEKMLSFFQEIIDVIEHDKRTATVDCKGTEHIIGYKLDTKNIVLWYDLICTMGSIFRDILEEGGISPLIIHCGIEHIEAMIKQGYEEFINCRNASEYRSAYGATLIFQTLIERDLKIHIQRFYCKKYLLELQEKIQLHSLCLQPKEQQVVDILLYEYGLSEHNPNCICDGEAVMTTLQYELLTKYQILDSKDATAKKLIFTSFTLNELLKTTYFKDIVDKRFAGILKYLFLQGNLNLRNTLAHCNHSQMYCYSLSTTALLYVIYSMITKQFFLK